MITISKPFCSHSGLDRTMSWLARSIVNSLRLDDDDDEDDENNANKHETSASHGGSPSKTKPEDANQHHQIESSSPTLSPSEGQEGRGVKEDLSELTKTFTRQFWGVASLLAPPPQVSDSNRSEPSDQITDSNRVDSPNRPLTGEFSDDAAPIAGIRSDFAEIGGKFKTSISKLSNHKAVSEITKIASNFLQFGPDQDEGDEYLGGRVVGVNDDVLAFVRNICLHPETWLDFPLPDDEFEDDFDMSDAQIEHAYAVERLAPELAAIRIELSPGYMSEGCFWKIYFVLLHPRLDKDDAVLLSTPQVMEARAMLTQDLHNRNKAKPKSEWSGDGDVYAKETAGSSREEHLFVPSAAQSEPLPHKTFVAESTITAGPADLVTEKHPDPNTEIQIIDKSVVEEGPVNQTKTQNSLSASSSKIMDEKYEDDGDDWLKEEESSEAGGDSEINIPIGNEEDVSFSDLEEDDGDVPTSQKKATYTSDSSTKDTREWVQLSRSSTDSSKDIEAVSGKQAGSEQVRGHDAEAKESNDWLNLDEIDVT